VKYPARALVGYMPREEALQLLAGGPVEGADIAKLERRWTAYVEAAANREDFVPSDPVESVPPEIVGRLEAFATRQDVAALMRPHDWTVGFVDISKGVLTYQRAVTITDVDQRVASARPNDASALVDICLPAPEASQMLGTFDPAQLAFTASSVNPNLRIGGFEIANVPSAGSAQPQQLLGFRISMGSTFVQLVEYKGRWMVRDGYHRLYGLLSRGITKVPSVVIRAKTFEETGATQPGFFSFETLYGPQPPRLTDFLDRKFAADVQVQANMRVVRIKAEQFFVPILEVGKSD
jgi:hypothetical protein